ncbi:MAG: hypothetical protein Q9164_007898, partial [Protoblastenia rupestris]
MLERQKTAPAKSPPLAYFYCSEKGADPRNADPEEILRALLRQLTGRGVQLPIRGSVAQDYQYRKQQADETGAQTKALDIRNDGDIVDRFDHCLDVNIDENLNRDDITYFVQHKVDQAIRSKRLLRGRVTSLLRNEIITTLCSGAQGMFRWVELSVDMLSNSRRMSVEKDVRTGLGKLPTELKQQYTVIYNDILESAPSTAEIAKRTFSWMLAAQRELMVEELIAAVALDDDGYYHEDLD